jgi:hypothetical protein
VAAEQAAQEQPREVATRLLLRRLKEIMVVLEERQTPLTLVLAEAVAHLPLEETELNHQVAALLREMEETALHLLFLARLQLTQAVVAVEYRQ